MPTGAIKPGAIGTRTVIMPRPAGQSLSRTPRGAARSTGKLRPAIADSPIASALAVVTNSSVRSSAFHRALAPVQ